MAVLMTLEVPGRHDRQYDRTNEILGIAGEHDAPPGLITHVCGITDDGILVVDVWESVAALDDFARNRLRRGARAGAACRTRCRTRRRCTTSSSAPARSRTCSSLIDMAGFTARGLRRDRRERCRRTSAAASSHPAVMHVAALEPDGNIRVVDLWDSEAAFGEFAETQIGPAAGDAMPPIVPRIVPVYNRLHAPSRTTA